MKLYLLPLFCAALTPTLLGSTQVTGSDVVGAYLAEPLKASLAKDGVVVTTDFRGGFDALRDLRSGRSSAALVYLRKDETLPEVTRGEWVAAPVAYQPVYVAVNRANKANEIGLDVLNGMYGDTPDPLFDTWSCLPSAGLSQRPLLFAPHPGKGLTVSCFRSEVLGDKSFRGTVRFAGDDDSAESISHASMNSMVLLSRPPKSPSLKVLSVADTRAESTNRRAYAPTASSLHSGDYPLRVTLFAVYPKKADKDARSAVRYMLSDDASKLLEEKGLLPAAENIRKKFTQSLDS